MYSVFKQKLKKIENRWFCLGGIGSSSVAIMDQHSWLLHSFTSDSQNALERGLYLSPVLSHANKLGGGARFPLLPWCLLPRNFATIDFGDVAVGGREKKGEDLNPTLVSYLNGLKSINQFSVYVVRWSTATVNPDGRKPILLALKWSVVRTVRTGIALL